jgi:ferredoxin
MPGPPAVLQVQDIMPHLVHHQERAEVGGGRSQPEAPAAVNRVSFSIQDRQVEVPQGTTLLEAARLAGVHLNASCNGKGSCGKCRLVVESGDLDTSSTALLSEGERARGYVLACQSRVVTGDVAVRIPEEALERRPPVPALPPCSARPAWIFP